MHGKYSRGSGVYDGGRKFFCQVKTQTWNPFHPQCPKVPLESEVQRAGYKMRHIPIDLHQIFEFPFQNLRFAVNLRDNPRKLLMVMKPEQINVAAMWMIIIVKQEIPGPVSRYIPFCRSLE
jgi:hypothetical protein